MMSNIFNIFSIDWWMDESNNALQMTDSVLFLLLAIPFFVLSGNIMAKAGIQSAAQSLVFSLPVGDIAGLRELEKVCWVLDLCEVKVNESCADRFFLPFPFFPAKGPGFFSFFRKFLLFCVGF